MFCLVYSRLNDTGLGPDKSRRLLDFIAGRLGEEYNRTTLFVETFRELSRLLGVDDPYAGVKEELNKKYFSETQNIVLEDTSLLLEAMALANSVDVSLPHLRTLDREAGRVGVVWFNQKQVLNLVENASKITIILDNAGEAVVDVKAALELARHGYKVLLIARGEPYEIDITYRELEELSRRLGIGDDEIVLASTKTSYPAYNANPSSEIIEGLREADVVLAKGMGNAEAYLEHPLTDPEKTVFLFRVKCRVLASILGVRLQTPAIIPAKAFQCMAVEYKLKLTRNWEPSARVLSRYCLLQ